MTGCDKENNYSFSPKCGIWSTDIKIDTELKLSFKDKSTDLIGFITQLGGHCVLDHLFRWQMFFFGCLWEQLDTPLDNFVFGMSQIRNKHKNRKVCYGLLHDRTETEL